MSFSDEMNRLRDIADSLERESVTMEEALERFEEGVALVRSCRAYLEETKRRVSILTGAGEEDFDEEEEDDEEE